MTAIEKKIQSLSVRELVIIAGALALVIVLVMNWTSIKAKFNAN